MWKESCFLGELHDMVKARGFVRVLNVIREFESWEYLMGLFDSVCARVWICVCTCMHESMWSDSAETRLGRAHNNQMWHVHRHMHTSALRCDSTNYLQHILFPQTPGHIFSLFLVNASLSEGSLHIFWEKRGIISHPPWSMNCFLKKGRGMLFMPQSMASSSKHVDL